MEAHIANIWQRHSLCAIRPAGSTDRTVRVWDLQAGLPLASTRRLGGIVRGIAIDEELLVAATSQVAAVDQCLGCDA